MVTAPGSARAALLAKIVADVAVAGLGDRSLRDLAAAVGTSHRLLIYHFGSRTGLVAAIVDSVEASQRDVLTELARHIGDPIELVLALWHRVSADAMRPFVRLFFEATASRSDPRSVMTDPVTAPWISESEAVTSSLGVAFDPIEIRLGIAVVRGLLVDVLATGDVESATRSLRRFLEMWRPGLQKYGELDAILIHNSRVSVGG